MLNPETLIDIYAMRCEGDCMFPMIENGTKLVFSPSEEIMIGDLVAVWFHPGEQPEGAHQVLVKKVKSLPALPKVQAWHGIAPAAYFESINPRLIYGWSIDRLQIMHKCIGYLDGAGKLVMVDYAEQLRNQPIRIQAVA